MLESSLGVKTTLFRPPYGIDHQPETASEIQMLPIAQAMGYVIIGARIDPHDWGEVNGGALRARRIRSSSGSSPIRGEQRQHYSDARRRRTTAATPSPRCRKLSTGCAPRATNSFPSRTCSDKPRAQVMPPLTQREWLLARADAFIFDVFRWARGGIAFIFMAGILLVGGRALIIGLLALIEKLRPAPLDHPDYKPPVSVLIPAYNEESVIVETVRAACWRRIIPIWKFSSWTTAPRTARPSLFAQHFGRDPRVRLLLQSNHGKPSALNHGLAEATGEIAVSIDADTIVDPEAIPRLVRHFANPKVGAVAGNVKVMNRNRWITRWQALEYITSQNLEKRAFDLLNCIPVVPGPWAPGAQTCCEATADFRATP